MKLALIGFMGSGKSTAAALLAKKLCLPLVEMDDEILLRSGRRSIPEIFQLDGEAHFRALESEVAQELATSQGAIISTGGGVVGNAANLKALRQAGGIVVYLQASFDTIRARIANSCDRPLMKDLVRAQELHTMRSPLYEQVCDFSVNTEGKQPADIVSEIMSKLPTLLKSTK